MGGIGLLLARWWPHLLGGVLVVAVLGVAWASGRATLADDVQRLEAQLRDATAVAERAQRQRDAAASAQRQLRAQLDAIDTASRQRQLAIAALPDDGCLDKPHGDAVRRLLNGEIDPGALPSAP